MRRQLVALLPNKVVTHLITGARPVDATAGVDLAGWKVGGAYGPPALEIFVRGAQAATIGAPAGGTLGVELWGFELGRWWLLRALNGGAVLTIASDLLGSAEQIEGVGGFERLFVAGSISAGSGTVAFVPLEVLW